MTITATKQLTEAQLYSTNTGMKYSFIFNDGTTQSGAVESAEHLKAIHALIDSLFVDSNVDSKEEAETTDIADVCYKALLNNVEGH